MFDDEAFSCRRYVMPLGEMVSALRRGIEPDPPLYYVMQNLWTRAFGVGPLGLRSLSIVCFLCGLLFVRLAATTWFDDATGRIAMLIAALHPAHLLFGMAARWYALMFALVSALTYVTGRLLAVRPTEQKAGLWGWWILLATAVFLTNYFGPVVIGLFCLVLIWGRPPRLAADTTYRIWVPIVAVVVAVLLASSWVPPFLHQLGAFPETSRSPSAYAAAAAKTMLALLTGNWASLRAWWAWGPAALFGIALGLLLIRLRRAAGPLTVLVAGCFVAGVASLSMKDKYIMTFSGPACVLVAGTVVMAWRQGKKALDGGAARIAVALLAAGWLGCYVNAVTQQNWSSLRWLDPVQAGVEQARRWQSEHDDSIIVATHPSVRYYAALAAASGQSRRISRDAWQAADAVANADVPARLSGVLEPRELLASRMHVNGRLHDIHNIITIETAEFSGNEAWRLIRDILDREYVIHATWEGLTDPDAALKDRLEPKFSHPTKRVIVRHWRIRG